MDNILWSNLIWLDFEGLSIGNIDDFPVELIYLQSGLYLPGKEKTHNAKTPRGNSRAWARRERPWFLQCAWPEVIAMVTQPDSARTAKRASNPTQDSTEKPRKVVPDRLQVNDAQPVQVRNAMVTTGGCPSSQMDKLGNTGSVGDYRNVCLLQALRALRVDVPIERSGPFRALRDGNEFLRPNGLRLVYTPYQALAPGHICQVVRKALYNCHCC